MRQWGIAFVQAYPASSYVSELAVCVGILILLGSILAPLEGWDRYGSVYGGVAELDVRRDGVQVLRVVGRGIRVYFGAPQKAIFMSAEAIDPSTGRFATLDIDAGRKATGFAPNGERFAYEQRLSDELVRQWITLAVPQAGEPGAPDWSKLLLDSKDGLPLNLGAMAPANAAGGPWSIQMRVVNQGGTSLKDPRAPWVLISCSLLWLLLVVSMGWPIRFKAPPPVYKPPKEPLPTSACGGCGYDVRGLTHLECPECGHDLRRVGIVGPRQSRRRWIRMIFAMLGLSVTLAMTALWFTPLVEQMLPSLQVFEKQVSITPPKSSAFANVRVTGLVRRWGYWFDQRPITIEMTSKPTSGNPRPVLFLALTSADIKTPAAAEFTILQWMKQNGVDISRRVTIQEANALAAAARDIESSLELRCGSQFINANRYNTLAVSASGQDAFGITATEPGRWINYLTIGAFWTFLWLMLLRAVFHRHRVNWSMTT